MEKGLPLPGFAAKRIPPTHAETATKSVFTFFQAAFLSKQQTSGCPHHARQRENSYGVPHRCTIDTGLTFQAALISPTQKFYFCIDRNNRNPLQLRHETFAESDYRKIRPTGGEMGAPNGA